MRILVIPLTLMASTAIAAPCEYERDVQSTHISNITESKVTDRFIHMTRDSKMRCTVNVSSLVKDKWYKQKETFVFDPYVMNAKEGCERAIDRAKERIISRVSPEVFRSSTKMKCTSKRKSKKKDVYFNVLPSSLMSVGEHREVVLNPKCSVVAGSVTYKEGYTLHGYKEVCDD